MKRSLLLIGAALSLGDAANAAEPTIYEDGAFKYISPNGIYAAAGVYGIIKIYDFQTGTEITFDEPMGADETEPNWSLGNGNFISNTGIVLGSQNSGYDASYYENGVWKALKTPFTEGTSNSSEGITPDGSRICGSIGFSADFDSQMLSPCYWDRNADGSYSDYHVLPCPETDVAGATPQYITALAISDDGRTIYGQITDCAGINCEPIIYTQAENGEWSYSLPVRHLFNPNNIELPEYPGNNPSYPDPENFMTEEEKTAFAEAKENYDWTTGEDYPSHEDYMTEEELEAYNEALGIYSEEMDIWEGKYIEYEDAFYQFMEGAPCFDFNNGFISADGKTLVSTHYSAIDDRTGYFEYFNIWTINLETGEIEKRTDNELYATGLCDNGVILAKTGGGWEDLYTTGWIIINGEAKELTDYITGISPEMGEWMVENMTHEVTGWNYETGEETTETVLSSGLPCATRDLSTILTWAINTWDFSNNCLGYRFDLSDFNSVEEISTPESQVIYVDANGNIIVSNDVAFVEIYNLNGARIVSTSNTSGINLNGGVYIVKATLTDGNIATAKLAL